MPASAGVHGVQDRWARRPWAWWRRRRQAAALSFVQESNARPVTQAAGRCGCGWHDFPCNLYSCRGVHPAHEVMYTMLDSICTSFRTAMEAVMQFSQASFHLGHKQLHHNTKPITSCDVISSGFMQRACKTVFRQSMIRTNSFPAALLAGHLPCTRTIHATRISLL